MYFLRLRGGGTASGSLDPEAEPEAEDEAQPQHPDTPFSGEVDIAGWACAVKKLFTRQYL